MKILLTGASGFIGQHLLPCLKKIGNVTCLNSDLRNYKQVTYEVNKAQPDIVIHLASRTEVEKSFYEQITFSEINYIGTINLIESCKQLKKQPHFLFSSTMEVYGWQPVSDEIQNQGYAKKHVAFDENTPTNPNAPYAVAKIACEEYLKYALRAYDLPFTALRQTNTFGRQDNNFFVTEQIISQMLHSKEISLGNPAPFRNFIYIDDLIDAWLSIIEKREILSGEILTIGPDNPIQIRKYANLIGDLINWKGEVKWNTKPARPGEIYWLNSSHKRISHLTGWKPKISLQEGLEKTIEKNQYVI